MAAKDGTHAPVLKGQVPDYISRDEFRRRFDRNFFDPAFDKARDAIAKLEQIAWEGYKDARKAPRTEKAGAGFANPDYDLSIEWKTTRDRLLQIDAHRKSAEAKSRVLVICGSPRNDGTVPAKCRRRFGWRRSCRRLLNAVGSKSTCSI